VICRLFVSRLCFVQMLQYAVCLFTLLAEMLLCSAIILPLPKGFRRKILESISSVWIHNARFRWFIKFGNMIVLGMFLDASWGVWRSYSYSDVPHHVDTLGDQGKDVALNLYESERNMFMSLFILFLFMLIHRFQSMMHQVIGLEKELSDDVKYSSQDEKFKKLQTQNEELERALEKHGESAVLNYESAQPAQ